METALLQREIGKAKLPVKWEGQLWSVTEFIMLLHSQQRVRW